MWGAKVTLQLGNSHADNAEMRFALIAQWTPRIIYGIVACVMIYYIFKSYSRFMQICCRRITIRQFGH